MPESVVTEESRGPLYTEGGEARPPQRVIVTGAAGFIGFHVSKRLLERGDEVIGIDSVNDYYDVATKKANELMAHVYAHLFAIPCTGLRFFTVYGPWGRPDMALFRFTRGILLDETIPIYNYGKMIRDFTYIDDIVEGVVRVLDTPAEPDGNWSADQPDPARSRAPYRVFNIGNNRPVQLLDYIAAIERCLGKTAKMELLPMH